MIPCFFLGRAPPSVVRGEKSPFHTAACQLNSLDTYSKLHVVQQRNECRGSPSVQRVCLAVGRAGLCRSGRIAEDVPFQSWDVVLLSLKGDF